MNFRCNLRPSRSIPLLCLVFTVGYFFRTKLLYSSVNRSKERFVANIDGFVDLNLAVNNSFTCVKTKVLLNKYRTTVCVHDKKYDTDVSGGIISDGIWEEQLVTRIIRILSIHRQLAFIDVGANIGIYTMYAASLGCSNIIAVECFRPNIERIRRAVQLENVQGQVILVDRALYNKSNVYLSLRANIMNNIGAQRLSTETIKNESDPLVVETIVFNDLLPIIKMRHIREAIIKVDIETSEHYLCETGEQIFNEVNIPFVMMEWANIKLIPSRADSIHAFFTKRGYIPFKPETCEPQNETNYALWNSQDVFWIKSTHTDLCKL